MGATIYAGFIRCAFIGPHTGGVQHLVIGRQSRRNRLRIRIRAFFFLRRFRLATDSREFFRRRHSRMQLRGRSGDASQRKPALPIAPTSRENDGVEDHGPTSSQLGTASRRRRQNISFRFHFPMLSKNASKYDFFEAASKVAALQVTVFLPILFCGLCMGRS